MDVAVGHDINVLTKFEIMYRTKIFDILDIYGVKHARISRVENGVVLVPLADIWWENGAWNSHYNDTIRKVSNVSQS